MATAPDTVADAIRLLEEDGYTEDFNLTGGTLDCTACPDDEAVVFGVNCPACGARGVLVSAFGPAADPDDLAWLTKAGA
jgi:hypothetical protein